MSTGMPELGSKISLISKADIRYEGQLFTVDPQECTIALSAVRSFGTEERETQYPVAPQNQVYDYILFRGSDIKDIRVINNNVATLPNDPAIMSSTMGQQRYQTMYWPTISQYGNPYAGMGAMGALSSSLAPGMPMNRDMRPMPKQQPSELLTNVLSGPLPQPDMSPATDQVLRAPDNDLIGGGSRSTTPISIISRKSPTMDQGVQVSGASGMKDDKKTMQRTIQPPGQRRGQSRERKESRGEHGPDVRVPQQRMQQPRGPHHQQNHAHHPSSQHHPQQQQHHQHQQQQHHQQHHHSPHQQQNHQQQQQQGNRGGWTNRNNMRQRGGGRGRGGPQGIFRPPQNNQNATGNKPKSTLKFEKDYDFEEANTQFEELRSQLNKLKVSDEVKPAEVNGDSEKKDDSGNETGAGEGEHEEEPEVYYDKSKSFFDNISCEAVERSKGRSQRTDWRTERKLNSETFGVAATRRGGYRGRGGYYNRGMYRGGYRGMYRGHAQRNPRPNPNNQPMSSQPPPVAAAAGK